MTVTANLKPESMLPNEEAPEIPQYIGAYKIIEKLGEGGFATVYLAHRKEQDPSQSVALKVLNARENYARFQREIETVARLNHPNIIKIYDTGEDPETGNPFFSMEYIPSGTLYDRLDTEYRIPRRKKHSFRYPAPAHSRRADRFWPGETPGDQRRAAHQNHRPDRHLCLLCPGAVE